MNYKNFKWYLNNFELLAFNFLIFIFVLIVEIKINFYYTPFVSKSIIWWWVCSILHKCNSIWTLTYAFICFLLDLVLVTIMELFLLTYYV